MIGVATGNLRHNAMCTSREMGTTWAPAALYVIFVIRSPMMMESPHPLSPSAFGTYSSGRTSTRRLKRVHVVSAGASVQMVLNAASAGDELLLENGTYTGIGHTVLDISKDITIRSRSPGMAVLDGQGARRVVRVRWSQVHLDGLKLTGGYSSQGGGLYAIGGHIELQSCVFSGNEAGVGGGVAAKGAAVTMTLCSVYQNSASSEYDLDSYGAGNGGGLAFQGGTTFITRSTIYANRATGTRLGASWDSSGTENGDLRQYLFGTGYGGGLYIEGGTVFVALTNIDANNATGSGADAYECCGSQVCTWQTNQSAGFGGSFSLCPLPPPMPPPWPSSPPPPTLSPRPLSVFSVVSVAVTLTVLSAACIAMTAFCCLVNKIGLKRAWGRVVRRSRFAGSPGVRRMIELEAPELETPRPELAPPIGEHDTEMDDESTSAAAKLDEREDGPP